MRPTLGTELARDVARTLAEQHPELMTVEQRKSARGRAVFIDYMRNAYGQTSVAPYSVRALDKAPVATPLRWDEIGSGDLHARKYTIGNVFRRLGQISDPWAGIANYAQSLDTATAILADRT